MTCLQKRHEIVSLHPKSNPYAECVQGYSPFAVARFFLERGANDPTMTPMKLMKLVYVAHGWHLVLANAPLIYEPVRAWKYGPVIESLYHAFKRCGNSQIPLTEAYSLAGAELSDSTLSLLETIWQKYGKFTGPQLSTLTHQQGTPWYTVWHDQDGKNRPHATIPNEIIQQYYLAKARQGASGQ